MLYPSQQIWQGKADSSETYVLINIYMVQVPMAVLQSQLQLLHYDRDIGRDAAIEDILTD
jgi:hypothetical protein